MAEDLSWVELVKTADDLIADPKRAELHNKYVRLEAALERLAVKDLQDLQVKLREVLDKGISWVEHTYPANLNYVVWPRYLRILNSKLPRPFGAWSDEDDLPETNIYIVGLMPMQEYR